MNDSWSGGNAYEKFMGRWSSLIAQNFLKWLAVPPGVNWLDVGCGSGTLTKLILQTQKPSKIISIDSSEEFISYAKKILNNPVIKFDVEKAESLNIESGSIDAIVSGLVLNFIPQREVAIREMMRVAKPGGTIGIFLWDYADGMKMLRYFWDAAVELDDKAKEFDEGIRFPLCSEGKLKELFQSAGLKDVEEIPIEIITHFKDFNDYWEPFLGNVGPAPAYAMSLNTLNRKQLKTKVHDSLPMSKDGSISIMARAWAVKGKI